jgi:hypothetical protein
MFAELASPYVMSTDTLVFTAQIATISRDRLLQMHLDGKFPEAFTLLESGVIRYNFGVQYDGGIRIYWTSSDLLKPNCYVRILSEYIQRVGDRQAYYNLRKAFEILEIDLMHPIKLSQVDIAFDFASDIGRYLESPDYHVRTKMHSYRSFHSSGRLTWRLWGAGNNSTGWKVRIYDKLLEVQQTPSKAYWLHKWSASGLDVTPGCWRVEFELKREMLKKWYFKDYDDFRSKRDSVIKWLLDRFAIVRVHGANSGRWDYVDEFQTIEKHEAGSYEEVFVDVRPEALLQASTNSMHRAVSALYSYIYNRCAYRVITTGEFLGSFGEMAQDLFDSFVSMFFFEPGQTESLVSKLLNLKGLKYKSRAAA